MTIRTISGQVTRKYESISKTTGKPYWTFEITDLGNDVTKTNVFDPELAGKASLEDYVLISLELSKGKYWNLKQIVRLSGKEEAMKEANRLSSVQQELGSAPPANTASKDAYQLGVKIGHANNLALKAMTSALPVGKFDPNEPFDEAYIRLSKHFYKLNKQIEAELLADDTSNKN